MALGLTGRQAARKQVGWKAPLVVWEYEAKGVPKRTQSSDYTKYL
jgi:hypothetical protein